MAKRFLIATLIAIATLFISLEPTARAQTRTDAPTFNRDVLPILQRDCQSCHRLGQIAPMSLLTYKDARPWARAN
jgi:hypothetical protein